MKELKLIDGIVEEPLGGAQRNPNMMIKSLKHALTDNLERLEEVPVERLLQVRYQRLMEYGVFQQ